MENNSNWDKTGLLRGLKGRERRELSTQLTKGFILLGVMDQNLDDLTKDIFLPLVRRVYMETPGEFSVENLLSVIDRNAKKYRKANNIQIDIKFESEFCNCVVKYFQDR